MWAWCRVIRRNAAIPQAEPSPEFEGVICVAGLKPNEL